MSQSLNLKLSDSTFAAIRQQAEAFGTSPAALIRDLLEKQYHLTPNREEAKVRFEKHFGEVELGYPSGADNESIEEDLAKAYADTHETS